MFATIITRICTYAYDVRSATEADIIAKKAACGHGGATLILSDIQLPSEMTDYKPATVYATHMYTADGVRY